MVDRLPTGFSSLFAFESRPGKNRNNSLPGNQLPLVGRASTGQQWGFSIKDADFRSKSYDQEESMMKQGMAPEEGQLEDMGLIACVPNPWNPQFRAIIVFGIRGIGT